MAFRLSIHLVPKPLHAKNLRNVLGKYGWDKLRKIEIAKFAGRCPTCGASENPLFGHEEWTYDSTSTPAIAHLRAIRAACQSCHRVEHFLHTGLMVRDGHYPPDAVDQAVAHFCRVNGVGATEFDRHFEEASARWEALSALEWTIDWGVFEGAVTTRVASGR